MELLLRPTVIKGEKLKNDYSVIFEGRSVGRIREATERLGFNPGYDWVINPPIPVPSWCRGSEADLEAAKVVFRKAWEQFYATLTPETIKYWHEMVDAAKGRF